MHQMDRSRIGLVIPALNEASSIEPVVAKAKAYGIPIVVDDGSTDDTANLARTAGATVVSHPVNLGYDKALDTGFKKAAELDCEVVITLDADGQHSPEIILQFINEIEKGYDLVVGKRPNFQRIGEAIFSLYSRARFRIYDPLCGMKAYRIKLYKQLGHFDSYESIGTELTIYAARNNFKVKQLDIPVLPREGTSKFGNQLKGNYKIIKALIKTFGNK